MDLVLKAVYRVDEVSNETTMNEGKGVTGSQTSHITVTCVYSGVEITRVYAVNEDISRQLGQKRDWLGRKLTGEKLQAWLQAKGCQLDSPDGPAYVRRDADGSKEETILSR
jgi:hypothetical protein